MIGMICQKILPLGVLRKAWDVGAMPRLASREMYPLRTLEDKVLMDRVRGTRVSYSLSMCSYKKWWAFVVFPTWLFCHSSSLVLSLLSGSTTYHSFGLLRAGRCISLFWNTFFFAGISWKSSRIVVSINDEGHSFLHGPPGFCERSPVSCTSLEQCTGDPLDLTARYVCRRKH